MWRQVIMFKSIFYEIGKHISFQAVFKEKTVRTKQPPPPKKTHYGTQSKPKFSEFRGFNILLYPSA